MLRLVILTIVALFVLSTIATVIAAVVAVVFTVAVLAVLAAAVGVPLYLVGRQWIGHHGLTAHVNPLEHLQHLYVEGKIDLFEYERRLATLLAVER